MPQDMREWLPPDHLCWKVLDVVEQLDLSAFEAGYRRDGQGGASYPPGHLVALLLYCYSKGIRSSRRIEQSCWDDVGCRVITANHQVDHSTVARFVRRHRTALNSLFVQVLALCGRRGLVDLSAVAVDGSPMEANASRDANQRLQRLEDTIAQCETEIRVVLEDALTHARSVEADGQAGDDHEEADDQWPRLSRLCDRLTRANLAMDRLRERSMPPPSEVREKSKPPSAWSLARRSAWPLKLPLTRRNSRSMNSGPGATGRLVAGAPTDGRRCRWNARPSSSGSAPESRERGPGSSGPAHRNPSSHQTHEPA
ncbi:transposase [Streptomyces sp. MUM 2J]|uniref:transposase n=1 Tax=Streptomyces sp. MUM 2J TaxID=2791987 RepID=UPI001F034A97|nr:transposase [Streptomyces sp. MUM 2J]MCH0566890.1 transposase [Streptomyces sp. MUM 2J]